MVCPKCGSQIQDGILTCSACGSDLTSYNSNIKIEDTKINNQTNEASDNLSSKINLKNKKSFILIVIVLIFMAGLFFVFNKSSFFGNNQNGIDKDIPTINKEETTTTSKKKTTTSSKQDEMTTSGISGGASVKIGDFEYIVPVGFEFREKEEDERFDYYIMRPQASVLIGLNFTKGAETLQDIYNKILSSYEENHTTVDTTSEVLDYEGYKYYRLSISEQDSKKKTVLHTELIIEIENGVYLDALLYEPVNYGEQNYFQSLFKFINSRK